MTFDNRVIEAFVLVCVFLVVRQLADLTLSYLFARDRWRAIITAAKASPL